MSKEEIENRMNHAKSILNKCGLEGQINIRLMISDIEYLLNEIKKLEEIVETYNAIPNDYMSNDVKLVIADRDYFNDGILKETCIPKLKIREKIKELVNKNVEVLGADRYEYAVRVLQELLEEKNNEKKL